MISTPLVVGSARRQDDVGANDPPAVDERREGDQQAANAARRWILGQGNPKYPNPITYGKGGFSYADPTYCSVIEQIIGVWSTFLKMTNFQQEAPRGARSLMSMALHATSDYIVHEQARLDNLDDKDEDEDVADFFITELENTHSSSNLGWAPLRELVRCHGIRLLSDVVRKQWLSPRMVRILVLTASEGSHYDGAEGLLSAWLSTGPVIPRPGRLDSSLFILATDLGLNTLDLYTKKTGRRGYLLGELSVLIQRGAIPVEWVATDCMKPIMAGAIQSISSDDKWRNQSIQFILTVLLAALDLQATSGAPPSVPLSAPEDQTSHPKATRNKASSLVTSGTATVNTGSCDEFISTALSNSVCSLLTILSGAHFTRLELQQSSDFSPMQMIIRLVSTIAQGELMSRLSPKPEDNRFSGLQSLRIGHALMADHLLSYTRTERVSAQPLGVFPATIDIGKLALAMFERFLGLVSSRSELVSEFSVLILQVARCWGRGQGDDGFRQLKLITENLTARRSVIMTTPLPTLRSMLNKVAVEAALSFAELTCLRDHHAWALEVQDSVMSGEEGMDIKGGENGAVPWTPSLNLSATGFRWEDGIGEWVARSPGVAKHNRLRLGTGSGPAIDSSPSSRRASGLLNNATVLSDSESDNASSCSLPSSGQNEPVAESSEPQQSKQPSRSKRKSLPNGDVQAADKRRKQSTGTMAAASRYPLRRRTVTGCGTNVDGADDDEDEDWKEGISYRRSSSRRGQDGLSKSIIDTCWGNKPTRRTPQPNSLQNRRPHLAVIVRAPPKHAATPKKDQVGTRFFGVVIEHNKVLRAGPESSKQDPSDCGSKTEAASEDEADDDDDEDDIFISAPALHEVHGIFADFPRRSWTRSDFRRLSGTRQLRSQKQGRDVIPCSQSSDDELSFV
jgi:hypothetical protein